jgi:hypothetical protein
MFTQVLLGWELSRSITWVLAGIFSVCILAWFLLLSRKGEEIRVTVARFSPEQEQLILSRLDALNQTLLRVSRN